MQSYFNISLGSNQRWGSPARSWTRGRRKRAKEGEEFNTRDVQSGTAQGKEIQTPAHSTPTTGDTVLLESTVRGTITDWILPK